MINGKQRVLVFGATGSIGSAIGRMYFENGWDVVAVSRSKNSENNNFSQVQYDPETITLTQDSSFLDEFAPYSAVCWAQGCNASDNVYDVNLNTNLNVYKINCIYILETMKVLLNRKLLSSSARFCIISSIWQNLARQDKLSYCMSKSALQGLVLSASADLAKDNILINAILPGALDTPMTRKNVTDGQLEKLTSATQHNRLPTLDDVANLAYFLCSEKNTGITGQFIAADLGFSHVRLL